MTAINTQLTAIGGTQRPTAGLAGQMAQAVLDMLESAQHVLRADPSQAKALVDRVSALLTPDFPPLNGLAPWQERKVDQFIYDNLDRTIGVGELARLVHLSPNHFSRMFKRSVGVTPHGYVMRVRLERAKTLLTQSPLSLCQIALDCGFCDQAHMSRIFHQMVGVTPGRWRKHAKFQLAA
jgi:transcriptional regulator GlxA family with amidase domain